MGIEKVQHGHLLCTVRAASDVSNLQSADRMLDAACCMPEVQQPAGTNYHIIYAWKCSPDTNYSSRDVMRSDPTVAMVQIMPARALAAACRLCHER